MKVQKMLVLVSEKSDRFIQHLLSKNNKSSNIDYADICRIFRRNKITVLRAQQKIFTLKRK